MADNKLVFLRPADGTGRLIFGDATETPVQPTSIGIDATFKDDMLATVHLLWDANVSRGEQVRTNIRWQAGEPVSALTTEHWQNANAVVSLTASKAQPGQPAVSLTGEHWQNANHFSALTSGRWQSAAPLRHLLRTRWQEAVPHRSVLGLRWQDGAARRHIALARWQEAIRHRALLQTRWQDAIPKIVLLRHRGRSGAPVAVTLGLRWQDARRPGVGKSSFVPPPEPPEPPCYDPAFLGRLEFSEPWANDGRLVFVCIRGDEPVPPGQIVVPVRSVYMTVNALELRRVAGNVSMPARGFSMRLDVDSWTWSWSAVCSGAALGLLDPGSGDPVEMEAEINGVLYRLYAEEVSRTRRFGENALEVSGRGLAAELDSPYAPTLNFSASAGRTAQQLAAEALQINGVGIGWDLDWQLTDWLVPGGVWAHQGAHISAVQKIVQAAGGYIQPHPTAKTLRVLHRYPSAPWDWAGLTPDIELPSDPVVVEGIRWTGRPAYNRVFLNGDVGANQWQVSRGGTAGDVNAPMIVDPMITHVDAARQRGRAELSNTGQQAAVSLSLPLLSETGLILPGKLVRYVDGAVTRLGMVRSTSLEWQRPKLRQVISLETHV